VRHAEVAARWHETAYGCLDVELSERGLEDTRSLGEAFRGQAVDAVLCSDLARARRLGEAIAEATGAPLRATPALREMNRGAWQGLPKSEFIDNWRADAERYWRDPFRWHTPGGEGDELLFARAWPTVEDALGRVSGGELVVAAHGQLIRVLISRALLLSVPESYEFYLDPAHATCLVDGPQGWRLEARNLGARELALRARG
jgi:broad specificity phosphatase PhoE